jgi:hypothetical protein
MPTLQPLTGGLRTRPSLATMTAVFLGLFLSASPATLQAQRVTVLSHALALVNTGDSSAPVDAGALPTSQPMQVTLRIAPTPDRVAALDQLLTDQTTSTSQSYHHWLTPQQFATTYGATDDQITTLTTWAQSQGLTVQDISAGKTRLTLSGTTGQVQQAFAVSLHHYLVSGTLHFANTSQPTVPAAIAPLVASISGLDDLPSPATAATLNTPTAINRSMLATATGSAPGTGNGTSPTADPLSTAASTVDANTTSVLTFSTSACSTDFAQSDIAAYQAIFRQANAQGITVLATSSCGTRSTGSFPASLPEVTALTTDPTTSSFVAIAPRPAWQVAPGLPADGNRYEPDLTTTSVAAFNQTLTTILQQSGGRQGNINAILYSLATSPGLYTQPDGAPAGTWEPSTGLGTVDLTVLAKVFPRTTGTFATTTSLSSSSYAVTYGQPFTLTSKVLAPTYTTANPTGTVTFVSSTQGTLGSGTIDTSGTASLVLNTPLNVGTYSIVANYSGDTNYAASSSAPPIILTVSIANATLTASISPVTGLPYGSTATVTATVTLPSSGGAPSGTVSAAIQGITSAVYTATLSPNPGGNSGTANIVVAGPPPGSYQVQVTCAGNSNYLCQTPVNLTLGTVKGNTLTTVTTVPAAPQAGQPVTLTATISDNGNGPGPYSFTGNVTFYDNGKLIATAAVGTNQASHSATLSGNVTHNIVATYSGDTFWNSSTSSPQSVNPTLLPSSLTLSSTPSGTALAGVNVVFTATVYTTISNTVGPTGTVSFFDTYNGSIVQLGGTAGAVALTPNGPNQSIARFTTTGLLSGTHSVYAIYNGDANFAPATSSTLPLTITDYNLTMIPQTLTLKAGQTGQVVTLLGLVGGFTGTVSFGCTPPPNSEATCSFSNASLTGGGSTTLSIFTTAPHATKPTQQASREGPWRLAAGSALAMLFCFALPRRRRAIPLLFTALLAASLAASMGCGNGGTATSNPSPTPTTPTDPGTPSGTQIFTITTAGSDGVFTVRHTYQYQVTIQ